MRTTSFFKKLLLTLALGGVVALPHAAQAQSKRSEAPAAGQSDKLDVRDLEKKYWASKDTDFSVVQNRTYSKVHRFAVSAEYGAPVQDPYNDGSIFTFRGNYFFTERYGVGVVGAVASLHDNDSLKNFQKLSNGSGAYPNHNIMGNYYGVEFNYVPIYAKMSLLNSRVIYFDMSFSPGFGIQNYDQQVTSAPATVNTIKVGKSTVAASLDITQHFFFSNHWALRVDWSHRFFSEKVADYNSRAESSKFRHDSILSGGLTFFY